jgi:hypothetical protein
MARFLRAGYACAVCTFTSKPLDDPSEHHLLPVPPPDRDRNSTLERRSRQRQTFHLEMHLTDTAAFGIDLTTPVYRCRACGKTHLSRNELRGRAGGALVDALRSAGIGRD